MKKLRIYLCCMAAVLLSAPFPAAGQELALEDFIRSALENNFSLAAAGKRAEASAGARSEALGMFFPSLSASARFSYTDTVPVMDFVMPVMADPVTGQLFYEEMSVEMGQKENYSARLQLRQPVFTFGQIRGAYLIASNACKIDRARYRRQKDILKAEIKKLFYSLLLAREMVDIAEKQLALMQDNLDTTGRLYRSGRVSKLDVNRVRSHLLRARAALAEARAMYQQARASLFSSAVIKDNGQELSGQLEYYSFEERLEEILDEAIKSRIELEIARLGVDSAKRSRSVEMARNLPQLYGFALYNFDRPYQMKDEWGQSWVAGAMLEFPLPLATVPGKVKRVSAQLNQARAERDNIKHMIRLEVKNNFAFVSLSGEKAAITEENLQITSENLDDAREQYLKGRISNIELNEAILDYTLARREYAAAVCEFLSGIEDLRLAAGGTLP